MKCCHSRSIARGTSETRRRSNARRTIHPTRNASVNLAERDGDEVVIVSARLKDVVSSAALVHQWNVTSQQNVAVQVVLPTEAEVAERRARHAKLDAITARLLEVDRQTPGGGGHA